jgi:vancomycin resistance protein YoaR
MRILKKAGVLALAGMISLNMVLPVRADASNTDAASGELKIQNNITIDGRDVSGLTYDEALAVVGDVSDADDTAVFLTSSYGDVTTDLKSLGFKSDASEVVEDAVKYGNSGNILKRYQEQKRLDKETLKFNTTKSIDEGKLDYIIQSAIGSALAQDADYNLIKHDDGTVSVTMGGGNVMVDAVGTADAIEGIIKDGWSGGDIKTDIVLGGENTEKSAQVAEIKDLLGTYTTNYNGPAGRMANIERATFFINGKVLFPGDQLSVHSTISPITTENGYYNAHVY